MMSRWPFHTQLDEGLFDLVEGEVPAERSWRTNRGRWGIKHPFNTEEADSPQLKSSSEGWLYLVCWTGALPKAADTLV